ncbi:hypothetical protein NQ314_005446 [Rhamnusium bicolor]|uniref:PiggyBac transposable element-derived protein domain-containing protein n=1 Tax=Rhamnusium bicolor TaxID=1586634 RepID=A0AAV8ZIB5_9CUCU|nr:hypothetical protein NQ314_005446 [Rhamnusium bicolor]
MKRNLEVQTFGLSMLGGIRTLLSRALMVYKGRCQANYPQFSLIVDEVIELIVSETNRFATHIMATQKLKKYARINKWEPTDREEIKKFLGLTLWMGLVRQSALPDYWSKFGIYRLDIPKSIMSRNRYDLLLHFSDNDMNQKGDRLANIQPLVEILLKKFQELLYPDEDIVVDETLVPWRGRLILRQYIPKKAHRSIKVEPYMSITSTLVTN